MAIKKVNEDATIETGNTVTNSSANIQTEAVLFQEETEMAKEPTVAKESKEESIPLSFVQKMMKDMEEKFTAQINKLRASSAKKDLDEDLEYVSDLEDDWMEEPAVFFAFSFEFSIHGDKKRGLETEPPHGAIKFKPLIRTKRKNGKQTQVVSVSSVKVSSKSVAEYLRGHSQYGIAFYENMESAMSIDSTWAQKMVEAQQSIGRLSDMQIIARAKQEGISVSQSPERMRRELVELTAKKSIAQQERMLYGSLKSANIDKGTDRSIIEKTIA
jgi:hypothetical protein